MSKLTDAQLILLSKAAARDDGCAVLPDGMKRPAGLKVGSSLVTRKLMREVRAKADMPVWRRDADNRAYSLVLTSSGRKAIGGEDNADQLTGKSARLSKSKPTDDADSTAVVSTADASKRSKKTASGSILPTLDAVSPQTLPSCMAIPRAGSKQALVIDMLSSKTGTTLDALVDATGWLPHTARAALTGLRKRGLSIERAKANDETSVYLIVSPQPAVTADTKSRAAA